jgi:hypothetical protein
MFLHLTQEDNLHLEHMELGSLLHYHSRIHDRRDRQGCQDLPGRPGRQDRQDGVLLQLALVWSGIVRALLGSP